MNAGWQVLDCINLKGSIRYKRGQLVVQTDDSEMIFPLAQIAVVLIGIQTTISGSVIAKLSEYDIALLVCDWRSIPTASAIPWREHTRIGARQQAQARLSLPRQKQAWSRVVSAKISGQNKTLAAIQGSPSKLLSKLARTIRSGDPDNFEARAARHYWPALSGETKFSRSPGIGGDVWNSALDYGYTLLRGYGIRAICAAGLVGTLGLFHHSRNNSFALVDDLMEPFRPMVDQIVFKNLDIRDELSPTFKQQLSLGLTSKFDSSGKSVPSVFIDFAQHYGLYVEGEVESLRVPTWSGELNAGDGK